MSTAIRNYDVLGEIGRGGMAVVHRARQRGPNRDVALKELSALHSTSPAMVERFLRETEVAGSLNHPNVVTVYEGFEHHGIPYIAMEYLSRGSLRPYLGALSYPQFLGVLEGVLAGLDLAAEKGIIHRDLKPENLMVSDEGRVKITDFGIAKATVTAGVGRFTTKEGMTAGTPTYMAPEQALASRDIGPWTDLYSLGVIAYEHVVGQAPFVDGAPAVILFRQVNEPIPPAITVKPDVDPELSMWIDRLLVKDPRDRTRSPSVAWEELEDFAVRRFGGLWRRQARLPSHTEARRVFRPLTPAPFNGQIGVAAGAAGVATPAYFTFVGSDVGQPRPPAKRPTATPRGPELAASPPGSALSTPESAPSRPGSPPGALESAPGLPADSPQPPRPRSAPGRLRPRPAQRTGGGPFGAAAVAGAVGALLSVAGTALLLLDAVRTRTPVGSGIADVLAVAQFLLVTAGLGLAGMAGVRDRRLRDRCLRTSALLVATGFAAGFAAEVAEALEAALRHLTASLVAAHAAFAVENSLVALAAALAALAVAARRRRPLASFGSAIAVTGAGLVGLTAGVLLELGEPRLSRLATAGFGIQASGDAVAAGAALVGGLALAVSAAGAHRHERSWRQIWPAFLATAAGVTSAGFALTTAGQAMQVRAAGSVDALMRAGGWIQTAHQAVWCVALGLAAVALWRHHECRRI